MMYVAGFVYKDLAIYLFISIFYVNNIVVLLQCDSKITQVLEFENIMVRFEVHVYVVPYKYHQECYEMLKCGHDIRL